MVHSSKRLPVKPRVRRLEPEDFDRCWAISTIASQFSVPEVEGFRAAWSYLLPRDEMRGLVIEDVSRNGNENILAFGASVFVSDECMLRLRESRRPFESTRILLRAGHADSGILNRRQIGLHNAQGGLNLVCPHRGEFGGLRFSESAIVCPDVFVQLAKTMVEVFQDVHRGFQLREVLEEVYGSFERDWCMNGGNWRVREDYSAYYSSAPDLFPLEQDHPYLIGATAAEADITSILWCMFQFTPPILGFSDRQKQVFEQALRGYSNRMIAERLRISEEAVYNCFRAGYEKIEDRTVLSGEFDEGKKRERFLALIRGHIEEVRPWRPKPLLKRLNEPVFTQVRRLKCG